MTELLNTEEAQSGGTNVEEKTPWQLQHEIDALEEQVATLGAQLKMPLTPGDVIMLKTVLSAEKIKLGSREECLAGLELISKLDGFLHPELPFDETDKADQLPIDG